MGPTGSRAALTTVAQTRAYLGCLAAERSALCTKRRLHGRLPASMGDLDKKSLNERDVCTKFITPAIASAGWDTVMQMREEVFLTDGRVIVRGRVHTRGTRKRADYVLYLKPGVPLAVVEAKGRCGATGKWDSHGGVARADRRRRAPDRVLFASHGEALRS